MAAAAMIGAASCAKTQEAADATTETIQESAQATADAAKETVAEIDDAIEEAKGGVIDLNDDNSLRPTTKVNMLTVVDFNATWCGPCKQFAPNFDAVAAKNAGKAVFYSVDVDVHPELAAQYEVQSIPMVVYIKPDGTTDSSVGYMDEAQFAEAVAAHL